MSTMKTEGEQVNRSRVCYDYKINFYISIFYLSVFIFIHFREKYEFKTITTYRAFSQTLLVVEDRKRCLLSCLGDD